ncbi:MAG TPA: (2Fe-2S) ferredoxin domain-containing protein [Spirochaetia bacterium]|nr:(2Fe-2S) ferredoxin domain-containing protein [Spirochaetales bacterium]HRY71759.1 (2Fe-2S) ferredoxin domain-containing protein [Spirochaetia bacterium]
MNDIKIWICMGSSCYARGNARNAELVQSWLKQKGLDATVEFAGTLCEGRCKEGPILKIGERLFTGVSPASVGEILEHVLGGK